MIWARLVCAVVAAGLSACAPTVRVATDEPITINLDVNIHHEILIRVDDELDALFTQESGLYCIAAGRPTGDR